LWWKYGKLTMVPGTVDASWDDTRVPVAIAISTTSVIISLQKDTHSSTDRKNVWAAWGAYLLGMDTICRQLRNDGMSCERFKREVYFLLERWSRSMHSGARFIWIQYIDLRGRW
jgi:hypothetical protein